MSVATPLVQIVTKPRGIIIVLPVLTPADQTPAGQTPAGQSYREGETRTVQSGQSNADRAAVQTNPNGETAGRDLGIGPQWMPKRVLLTPAALELPWGRAIADRVESLGIETTRLSANRIVGPRGASDRQSYAWAKSTLAVVVAPKGQFRLQPIPPSADYQFHLAQGCPAHCQYCYLAGSLSGAPVIKAYANLPEILENLRRYKADQQPTSFEVSCYTDPLGIEHLTGSLRRCIEWFGVNGDSEQCSLRWVSKFAAVDDLIGLDHGGNTQCRFSMNASVATGLMEGGTAKSDQRIAACRRLADDGYPIGLVIAPIMPVDNWRYAYTELLDRIEEQLGHTSVTFELITHRFTPGSKAVLQSWYPKTKLDLDESVRDQKRNKFGGVKYVYPKELMRTMKDWFYTEIQSRFPAGEILYWT